MLTSWDILLLQGCFKKIGRTEGGLHCPAVIIHQRWNGQARAVGGASRWTAVELCGQLTIISAHLPHIGRKLGEFMTVLAEIQDFMHERSGQRLVLGGDFNASFCGLTVHKKHLDGTWGRTDANNRLQRCIDETGSKTNSSDGLRLV